VDGSVLWLRVTNETARANLRRAAEARGVAAERLVFAPGVRQRADHLARHRFADLFLDTIPYNAHATACDALFAGLPVLTCRGRAFAARVGTSLLHAVDLPELVTTSMAEYEALALELASDPARLRSIRGRLAENRARARLFDADRFRRHLEAAYRTMVETRTSGEAARSFAVEPIAGPAE
jgi:predicted O-linked N-acetylglucosamine transferase (SPINDLY family)